MRLLFISMAIIMFAVSAISQEGQRRSAPRTQEVRFDGSDVEGTVRTPDGAFLRPQRGVRFMPLYQVDHQFDREIKSSVEYLR